MPSERRAGDVTKNANRSNKHHDTTDATPAPVRSGAATGVTPLLLKRLQAIFDHVNGSEIMAESDMTVRNDKLRHAAKEAHVISRTACALPKEQRQMVSDLVENVKAVVTALRNMPEAEVAISVERYKARKAAKAAAPQEEAAPAAAPAEASASASTSAADQAQPAATAATAEAQGRDLVPRFSQWSVLLRSADFANGTIEARQRAVAFATQDVHHGTALLDDMTDDALIDQLIAVIEDTTEAIMVAKRNIAVAAANQPDAAAAAAAEEEDTFSVGAITEVLSEFHDALNADDLLQVEPGLRSTLVTAILERLREIETQLVPKIRGDETSKAHAVASVVALIKRAERLLTTTTTNTASE